MTFRHLRDSHAGETCILVGNGPSLRSVPRAFFSRFPTFGCGLICKLPLTPDYYTCVDDRGIKNNWELIEATPSPVKFVREGFKLSGYQLHCISRWEFSLQPNVWVWHQNSGYVMMQLAYYLGFTTALLVGFDHNYHFKGDANTPRRIKKDTNHFCEDYLAGQIVTYPKKDIMEVAYGMAKQVYEADGRRIINLTDGSELHIFPQEALEKWL